MRAFMEPFTLIKLIMYRLGLVKPEDAPAIVARACEDLNRGVKPLGRLEPPVFRAHWRGRMGLTLDEQKELHALGKSSS